jgi:hypothetical protein
MHKVDPCISREIINKYDIIFRFAYRSSRARSLNIRVNQVKKDMRKRVIIIKR